MLVRAANRERTGDLIPSNTASMVHADGENSLTLIGIAPVIPADRAFVAGLLAGLASEWDGLDNPGKDHDGLQSRKEVIEDEPIPNALVPNTQIESPPPDSPSQSTSQTDDSDPVFVGGDDVLPPDEPESGESTTDSASEEPTETPLIQRQRERSEIRLNTGTADKPEETTKWRCPRC